MTKADREYAGMLKRFLKTQHALLATNAANENHVEQEIAAKIAQVKASRAYLKALRAENRAERKILARVEKDLAKMQGENAK